MKARLKRRFEMFGRLQTFSEVHGADFDPSSIASKEFANITQINNQLTAAGAGQHPGRDTAKAILLERIYRDVQKILRTAEAIALEEPGFADPFHPERPASEKPVLAAQKILKLLWVKAEDDDATKAVKAALVAKFVAHELEADFVTHLKGDVDTVGKDKDEHEISREEGVGDTAEIDLLVEKGMKSAQTLDAIMHNKYDANPQVLAEWRTARHVEADPRHKKNEPPTPPPAP